MPFPTRPTTPANTAWKLRLMFASFAIAGICACSSPGPVMQPFSQDGLPDAVKVPPGHRVALETAASGSITYECRPKKDMAGQFEWVFVGPDASLRDRKGAPAGKYFGPPATWQGNDGSQITGTQLAVASTGGADIPLQLVKANAANGPGSMQGVAYIQRLNTRGGVAPASACGASTTGQKQVVSYAADYVFWRAM
jgi:Protein of unknown function (DUF3455)